MQHLDNLHLIDEVRSALATWDGTPCDEAYPSWATEADRDVIAARCWCELAVWRRVLAQHKGADLGGRMLIRTRLEAAHDDLAAAFHCLA